uniref:Uncharacterized protein n=1 Tax=Nicotiana tabacum TaxID=4097 RepID=A0A1S3Y9Q4_TOBAC|nr:PREDICTED: uncharacterized protein LOC107774013 [Nicotiana tabacum]
MKLVENADEEERRTFRECYKKAKKEAKLAVTAAKTAAFECLYVELGGRGSDKRMFRKDRIRNEVIKDKVSVAHVEDKLRESRLRLFEYVKRRNINGPVRRCERFTIAGQRRGRVMPRKYWGEVIRQDMTLLQLTEHMTLYREV